MTEDIIVGAVLLLGIYSLSAIIALSRPKPTGMSEQDYQTIKQLCQDRWDNDFFIISYCEKQQLKGWSETR